MFVLYFFVAILGLVIGSFVSVLSYRIPNNTTFIKGRSFCPNCRQKILWYDNIPLFSFFLLRRRCRNCKQKISLRYPLIESISAIGFLTITYFTLPDLVKTIFFLIVFILFLTMFVTDLEYQIIPDSLVFLSLSLIFIFTIVFSANTLFTSLISGFFASCFLLLIHLITKGKGMGLGDVKFAIVGGMFIGIKLMPIWLLLSFLTGALGGIILMILGRAKMKTEIAFGPFLIIGLLLSLVFGQQILNFFGLL